MLLKKIITVFGATGAQGSGVAHAILNDPNSEFVVRAITRNPDSDKAKALSTMAFNKRKPHLPELTAYKQS